MSRGPARICIGKNALVGSDALARVACEAVLGHLEAAEGRQLVISGAPDKILRNAPAVDFLARGEGEECAIEHTRIESFSGQLEDDHRLVELFGPVADELEEVLPTDSNFDLFVRARGVGGATNYVDIRRAIREWAVAVAPTLIVGSPGTGPAHYRQEKPAGVPFEVTLVRWPRGARADRVTVGRWPPEELENERRARLRAALEAKCPKLDEARQGHRSTILVLENRDIALANPVAIGEALKGALEETKAPPPDHVFLVDTTGGLRVTKLK